MKVLKPLALPVGSSRVVSIDATESTAAYSAVTNYAQGAIVHVAATGRVYESITNSHTGNYPPDTPGHWLDVGPMNRWALFDTESSTQTTRTASLTVVLDTGYINSLALINVAGQTLVVTGTDGAGGPAIYSRAVDLDGTVLADWYQYFYEPTVQLAEVVLDDLPPYANARYTVTVSATSGAVAVGHLSVGTAYTLGDTAYGATAGIIDYSRKETDAFGGTAFVRRRYSKRMRCPISLPNGQINKVQRVLADLRATPTVWVGSTDAAFAPLVMFGFYRDFSIDIAYPSTSQCSLEVEGLA